MLFFCWKKATISIILEECKNRVWHKKFFFPRLLKLLPFPTNTVDAVFSSFCIFESIKNSDYPPPQIFFSRSMLTFFLCFIFFFNRKVRGFSCEKMLLIWIWPVSIPEYLFHGKSGKNKWRKTFSFEHTLFPIKGFFLSCKGKKILKKNHPWPVEPVFQ